MIEKEEDFSQCILTDEVTVMGGEVRVQQKNYAKQMRSFGAHSHRKCAAIKYREYKKLHRVVEREGNLSACPSDVERGNPDGLVIVLYGGLPSMYRVYELDEYACWLYVEEEEKHIHSRLYIHETFGFDLYLG
ncbi:hypothetical protein OSTOST_12102, partial [Ostertagia ostertagi]